MSSAEALNALGSDLAFSVSFTIAAELRLSAVSAGLSEHELIALVLVLSVVLSALPLSLRRGARLVHEAWPPIRARHVVRRPRAVGFVDWALSYNHPANSTPPDCAEESEGVVHAARSTASLFQFLELLFSIARRIAMSLLVQLVAATAVSKQTLRITRVLSLFSVAVFFIFLQNSALTAVATTHVGKHQ